MPVAPLLAQHRLGVPQHEVRRLGETAPRPIDVRVVSAANRAMAAEAAAHRFRADLLYRLDVIHLRVPPLRERPEDIALLAGHDVSVAHNPVSNMILASGVCPVPRLLREGVPVGLGLDGPASNDSQNMLETLKVAALLQKVHHLQATALTAPEVLEMATLGGARALGLQAAVVGPARSSVQVHAHADRTPARRPTRPSAGTDPR